MPLFFNFALPYTIKWVQVNQDGLKLNDTHQLLVYVDGVNIQGVPGGKDLTSGECSLGQTIPI